MNINYRSIKKIPGWLGYVDFEIFKTLNSSSISNNAALEIGVHYGKSALAITCFSKNRKIYVIDIFGNQGDNIDSSGSGDEKIFLKNMKKFGVQKERIVIDNRMSSEVTPNDIKSSVGLISFFHIDGGHHKKAVTSDIKLACSVSSDDCVIAIDDMFRPEWPEVSSASFGSRELDDNGFSLFAIGFNKGYWCKKEQLKEKQKLLLENKHLQSHLNKIYEVKDRKILIFQRYPLPEWSKIKLIAWYLEIYHPSVYRVIFKIYKIIKKKLDIRLKLKELK